MIYIGGTNGFTLSGIPLGSDQFITTALQKNLHKTKNIIANISKLTNVQEKLILLLQEKYNTYWLRCPCTYRESLRVNMTKQ